MTIAAIGNYGNMTGTLNGRIDCGVRVMAGFAALQGRIKKVVEYTTHAKSRNTVAGITIHQRVDKRMPDDRAGRADSVAGITAIAGNQRSGMIGVCASKGRRIVASAALGIWRVCEIGIHRSRGDGAVVTTRAFAKDIRMIKAAIRVQFQKMRRVMTIIALRCRRNMVDRFADRRDIVVTFAARAKYLLVID